MDPWSRWRQEIDLVSALSGMVSRGRAITEARAKREQQFRHEKQRREEALQRIRGQDADGNGGIDSSSGSSCPEDGEEDASESPAGGVRLRIGRTQLNSQALRPGQCTLRPPVSVRGRWMNSEPSSLSTSRESLYGTEDSIDEATGVIWKRLPEIHRMSAKASRSSEPMVNGPWWILGGRNPSEADFVVYGFLATMLATPT